VLTRELRRLRRRFPLGEALSDKDTSRYLAALAAAQSAGSRRAKNRKYAGKRGSGKSWQLKH